MKRFILALLIGVFALLPMSASSKSNSPWKEVQCVVLPQNVEIHEGLTRSGNPKCWIEIGDINVTISPSNAAKFKNGEVQIELVKWQNSESGAFKYSTRQAKSASKSKNKDINLLTLFK